MMWQYIIAIDLYQNLIHTISKFNNLNFAVFFFPIALPYFKSHIVLPNMTKELEKVLCVVSSGFV